MTDRARVLLLGGPTASGKSALAVALAQGFDGVVVNADSMQIYAELRLITARPGEAEEAAVPHRLYGVRPAAEPCSAALWRTLALAEIDRIQADGGLPILVGGSGLYFRALLHGLAPVPPIPPDIRVRTRAQMDAKGPEAMHALLATHDPDMAARLKPGDRQRVIRALEVIEATGRSLASWQRLESQVASPKGRVMGLVLDPPREALYAACSARFAAIAEGGGPAEAAAMDALGLAPTLPAMKAVGLRELIALSRGEIGRDEAIAAGTRATRRYAKRQRTWFRHQMADAARIEARVTPETLNSALAEVSRIVLTDSA